MHPDGLVAGLNLQDKSWKASTGFNRAKTLNYCHPPVVSICDTTFRNFCPWLTLRKHDVTQKFRTRGSILDW